MNHFVYNYTEIIISYPYLPDILHPVQSCHVPTMYIILPIIIVGVRKSLHPT